MSPRPWLAALLLALLALGGCNKGGGGPTPPEPCHSNEDCAADQVCGPDGACVMAECLDDAACIAKDPRKQCQLGTKTCVFREGFADECDAARPCDFGKFCSTLLGRCLDAAAAKDCTRRAQCPAGQFCDRGANKCIPETGCYGDAFCEDEEICDLMNHTCHQLSTQCTRCSAENRCEAGSTCDVAKKECVASGTMAACRTGEFCDPLSRCVQCINDDQCGMGTFCNVSLGRCESNIRCVNDESECPTGTNVQCVTCVLPQICDSRTKTCQAPPTVCENDLGCPGDQYCNKDLDPPICIPRIPDCLNDLLEPDNRSIEAHLLAEGSGPRFDELKLCQGDADWYKIEVRAGTFLTVDARFLQKDGDIDLQLYLADGTTLVDESRSVTDNERVELEVGTDLTVLVKVFLAVPNINPVPYSIIVSRDTAEVCPDDGHEPDDLISAAKEIASDQPYDGRLCSADPDWFVVRNVPAQTRISAHLDFRASLGDLDLELYRSNSLTPLARDNGLGDGAELVYDASFGGDYFVRVSGKRADANVYTLRVDLRDNPAAVCADDIFEPNNRPTEAIRAPDRLPGIVTDNLSICSGDEDWYVMNLGFGDGIIAEVGFLPSADLELKLYGPDVMIGQSTPIAQSRGSGPREYLAFRTDQPGDHYVRVHGLNAAASSPYQLHLEKIGTPTCTPDFIDLMPAGNSQATPFDVPLPPTRLDKLWSCFGDEDWFRVFLVGGFTNIIRLQFVEADAILNLELYDLGGNLLAATAGTGSVKEISGNVNGQGFAVALVHVLRAGSVTGTPYSLTIDEVPLFDCQPDLAEPNNFAATPSLAASATVSPILVEDLSMCATTGDEDWYEIHPPAGAQHIDAQVDFASGDLFLELFAPGGTHRACVNLGDDRCYSDGFGLSERVSFTATTAAAAYYLRVGSLYSNPNAQIKPSGADTPYQLRVEYSAP